MTPSGARPAALRVVLRVAIVAAVLAALIAVEISSRSGVTWRLITFTYQANVLAAAYYAWTRLASRRRAGGPSRRGRAVCRARRRHLESVVDGPQHGLHGGKRPATRRGAGPCAQRLAPRGARSGTSALVASVGLAGVPRVVCRAGAGGAQRGGAACTLFLPGSRQRRGGNCARSTFVCWRAACSPSAMRCWQSTGWPHRPASTPCETF